MVYLTVRQYAELIGITRTAVYKIIREKRLPEGVKCKMIAGHKFIVVPTPK